MKKILSMALALGMVASMGLGAWAEENPATKSSTITYSSTTNGGKDSAYWTVTVPTTLNSTEEGEVLASGFWAPSHALSVTADATVNMKIQGVENNTDFTVVPVTYTPIALVGNYGAEVSKTEQITVDADNTMSAIKFGKWEGTLTFYINLDPVSGYVSGNIGGTKVEATSATDIDTAIATAVETGEQVTISLTADVELDAIITVPEGANIVLDMNGKTMTAKDSNIDPMIETKVGSSLVITGNGTFDCEDNYALSVLIPRDNTVIENGRFVKNAGGSGYGSLIAGASSAVGTFVIKDGYFDGGYYVEDDCFNNMRNTLNKAWSTQSIQTFGGTFVGASPAWGDEGMAVVCPHCEKPTINEDGTENYGYCQGVFLYGQDWKSAELPAGYTITEGVLADGRPTYTVSYAAPIE